jgi:hypothetical protein
MKYVVARIKDKEEIFLFPRSINHDSFSEILSYIRHGSSQDWSREFAEPVSAGFVDAGVCHGYSETLKLKSRGAVDTALLTGFAWTKA